MHFLLTNDDGIDGPGLAASERLLGEFGHCTVVAPMSQLSGCGHQATHRRPIETARRDARHVAVGGFPADCVRLGLTEFAKDADWIVSGINPGGNLGADIYMSGTAAAAREAAFLGRPALALSQLLKPGFDCDWDRIIERLRPVVAALLQEPLEPRHWWNLNLPCPPEHAEGYEVVPCRPDDAGMDVRYVRDGDTFEWAGVYRDRGRTPGRDFDVCLSGGAALSKIALA